MAEEQGRRPRGQGEVQPSKDARVISMRLTLGTGSVADAQTNGEVYLVAGGREFNVKRSDIDDRRRGARDVYRLGSEGSNIENRAGNNPTGMLTEELYRNQLGLRYAPVPLDDAWNLASAKLEVTSDDGFVDEFALDPFHEGMWLGFQTTMVAALRPDRLLPPTS